MEKLPGASGNCSLNYGVCNLPSTVTVSVSNFGLTMTPLRLPHLPACQTGPGNAMSGLKKSEGIKFWVREKRLGARGMRKQKCDRKELDRVREAGGRVQVPERP